MAATILICLKKSVPTLSVSLVLQGNWVLGRSHREKYPLIKVLLNGHVGRPFEAILSLGVDLLDVIVLQELPTNENVSLTQVSDQKRKINATTVDRQCKKQSDCNRGAALAIVASWDDWLRELNKANVETFGKVEGKGGFDRTENISSTVNM